MNGVEQSISTILDSGVYGAIIVLLGFAVVYLYRDNVKQREGRLSDSKEVGSKVVEPLEAIKKIIIEQGDERKKEKEDILDAVFDNTKSRRR